MWTESHNRLHEYPSSWRDARFTMGNPSLLAMRQGTEGVAAEFLSDPVFPLTELG